MESTKDYSIFKKILCNRKVEEGHVLKLMRSIKFKNLLPSRPMLVNSDLGVIDGQHRLEAAKRLGLEIYYNVDEEAEDEDIFIYNETQKPWRLSGYLDYYVSKGREHYIRLSSLMKREGMDLGSALAILGFSTKTNSEDFKKGKFVYPVPQEEFQILEIIGKSKRVVEYLENKLVNMKVFLHGPRLKRVFYIFFSNGSVDIDVFMNKLNYKLELIRPAQRISDLLDMLQNIYNWKNKNPIDLSDSKNAL